MKIGTRVKLLGIGRFIHSTEQGLFVGNTGTVVETIERSMIVRHGEVAVKLDGHGPHNLTWPLPVAELVLLCSPATVPESPYKVGDRVRVHKPWTSPQNLAHGEVVTVVRVGKGGVKVKQDGLDKSRAGGWNLIDAMVRPIKPPKWKTPGEHTITSYRSFRRYKAAGATFGIPMVARHRPAVIIDSDMARRRAQFGRSLVAIIPNN